MAPPLSLFVNTTYTPRPRNSTSYRSFCCAVSPTSRSSSEPKISSSTFSIPPVVFVLGGPGSGKGTQCSRLVRDFGYSHVTVGDLLRQEAASETEQGEIISRIMQAGGIVPSEITMRLLEKALRKPDHSAPPGVLIDGFPRNLEQARLFETNLTPCKFVVYFHCDAVEMRRRILRRARTSGRADDDDSVITSRLETYLKKTMPVIELYRQRGLLRHIDSTTGGADFVYLATKQLFMTEFAETRNASM